MLNREKWLMRKHIGVFVAACLYYSGLVGLARWWRRRAGPHLIILNYHRASGGALQRHLLYLRRHYRMLPLEAALEELYGRPGSPRQASDGRTPLVLTFDDGYHDSYTHALALAQELQVPITIFLIPGYIQTGDYFWWEEGKRLVKYAQEQEATIKGRIYQLNLPEERKALARAIETEAFYASSVAEREAFLVSVHKALALPSMVVPEEDPASPLTWGQVCKMQESGWVSFGAHTMHHPALAYMTDLAEIRREVGECRTVLGQQLGHPVRIFAYPFGQLQHIGKNVRCAVQEAGYEWAVTTLYGFNTPRSDPYLLRRIEVDITQHWLVVAAETAGLWSFFARLRWLPFVRKHFTAAD
jgi:peptidoglycan/xylan/chitin deacetylase (PgdA/CDA1 family)